jgi:hypothetical protein
MEDGHKFTFPEKPLTDEIDRLTGTTAEDRRAEIDRRADAQCATLKKEGGRRAR